MGKWTTKIKRGADREKILAERSGAEFILKKGEPPLTFQAYTDDEDGWIEATRHVWSVNRDGKKFWNFIPCAGEDCPMCEDEETYGRPGKVNIVPVYNVKEDKAGYVTLGSKQARLFLNAMDQCANGKYGSFTERVWTFSRVETKPIDYSLKQDEKRDTKPLKSLPAAITEKQINEDLNIKLNWFLDSVNFSAPKNFTNDDEEPNEDDDDEIIDDEGDFEGYEVTELKAMYKEDKDEFKNIAKQYGVSLSGKKLLEVCEEISEISKGE